MPNTLLYNLDKIVPVYSRDKILVAESTDGLNWARHIEPAVNAGQKHDADMSYWSYVWQSDSDWNMVYAGAHNLREKQGASYIFHTTSPDGLNWNAGKKLMGAQDPFNFCPRIYDSPIGEKWLMWTADYKSPTPFVAKWNDGNPDENGRKELMVFTKNGDKVGFEDFNLLGKFLVGKIRGNSAQTTFFFAEQTENTDRWELISTYAPPIENPYWINNPSLVFHDGIWKLFFRVSFKTAWGSMIWCAQSSDMKDWQLHGKVLDYAGCPRKDLNKNKLSLLNKTLACMNNHELGGVAFCHVVNCEDKLRMYYGGFWGLHLLMPYTYWSWRPRN